ncbi:MAG: hypothetical protein OHK0046_47550 [Anaerolineae bacterium]
MSIEDTNKVAEQGQTNPSALMIAPPQRRSIIDMSQSEFDRIERVAALMAKSKLNYQKSGNAQLAFEDVMMVMLKGVELGLEPIAAYESIDIISGKPALKPQGMLGLIYKSGLLKDIKIEDTETGCMVTMERIGKTPYSTSFTMADAQAFKTTEWRNQQKVEIALAEKHNWKSQPRVMCKWRAISACARVVFPDILMGLYTPEELNPDAVVNAEGEIIDMPARPATSQPAVTAGQLQQPPMVIDPNAPRPRGDALKEVYRHEYKADHWFRKNFAAWIAKIEPLVDPKLLAKLFPDGDHEWFQSRNDYDISEFALMMLGAKSWNDFEAGAAAYPKLEAVFADAHKEQPKPETESKNRKPKAKPLTIWSDTSLEEFSHWVWDYFELPLKVIADMDGAEPNKKYDGVEPAKAAYIRLALASETPMLAAEAKLDGTNIVLISAQPFVVSRNQLAEWLGNDFVEGNDIPTWKPGTEESIEPLRIRYTWDAEKGAATVTSLELVVQDVW